MDGSMLAPVGRVIMVSGANRGIGRGIAEALYEGGYTVSLGARDPAALAEVASDWAPERVLLDRYNAEDQASHRQWVAATADRFGRVDGLVNNAGMVARVTVEDEKDEELDRMWAVNVKAPLSMIRTALPHLRRSGAGRVVNVSSLAGKAVYNNNAGYAMTKFAAVALSHATRRAGWEDGVRCTALCPGFVATDMTADVETFPHDQMMEPSDIAGVVLTLLALSNKASIAELVINCRDDVTM
jgi:NADP-dependent 3-hydroxy acid dehydrogenase YdfG